MLEVAPLKDQLEMDICEFFRQKNIWERRAKQRIKDLKTKNGR